jgi:hypothetical protein
MRPVCGEHGTTLQPGRRTSRPQWVLVSEVSYAYGIDLHQMVCPLDSHGGQTCIRAWGMDPLTFTVLPHGLLRMSPEGLEYAERQELGTGEGDSGPLAVGADEGSVVAGSSNGHQDLDPPTHPALPARQEDRGTLVLGDWHPGDPVRKPDTRP